VPTLLVASAGGHLEQLWNLRPRLEGIDDDCTWLTYDTPQSRSLLRHEQRIFIPTAGPRDARVAITHTRMALHVLGLGGWRTAVSTGALPSVPFLTLGRARGVDCHFIDSATRVQGPSLSGSMLARVPGIALYSQYRWADHPGWEYRGSVFDRYASETVTPRPIRRAVVTLGTIGYGFDRLVRAAQAVLPPEVEVLWQLGHTAMGAELRGARPFVPAHDLRSAMAEADVVICHAGVGSALTAFEAGRCPIIVPRRRACQEHIDDHQAQLAAELAGRGLAIAVEADQLTPEVLADAAARGVVVDEDPPPFVLGRGSGHRPSRAAARRSPAPASSRSAAA